MKIQEKADRVNAGTTRRSLGKSVLIWMTLISMVPLVVLAYQGYHCARQALLERAETHMVSVLVSKRALIEQWLGERRDDIEVLSKEPCLIGLCGENSAVPEGVPTSHALQTLVRQNPAYGELAAFDNNWRLVASAYSDENVAHSSPEEEVKHLAEDFDGVYFGSAHLHNNGQIGFHMLVPAKDHEGRQVGTLFANLNLTESLNLLLRDRRGLSETGKVYLISKDLLIITEPIPDSDAMAFQANANPVVRELAMLPSPHARIYDDYRGKSVLGASAYIESMGWYLVAETDAVDALAWLGMLRRRAFITGVLTLSMVFFLSADSSYKRNTRG